MYAEHPVFHTPDGDAVVWRYMDFTKFVSLLDRRALFFARAHKLGDPFEGTMTRANLEERSQLQGEGRTPWGCERDAGLPGRRQGRHHDASQLPTNDLDQ